MQVDPSNIKWVDQPIASIVSKGVQAGGLSAGSRGIGGRGVKRSGHARDGTAAGTGRGRGARVSTTSNEKLPTPEAGRSWRGGPAAENGADRKGSRPLESAPLEALVKEVKQIVMLYLVLTSGSLMFRCLWVSRASVL